MVSIEKELLFWDLKKIINEKIYDSKPIEILKFDQIINQAEFIKNKSEIIILFDDKIQKKSI